MAKTANTTYDQDNIEPQWLAGEQNTNTVHLQATGAVEQVPVASN